MSPHDRFPSPSTTDVENYEANYDNFNGGALARRNVAGLASEFAHNYGPHWKDAMEARRTIRVQSAIQRMQIIDREVTVFPAEYGVENANVTVWHENEA